MTEHVPAHDQNDAKNFRPAQRNDLLGDGIRRDAHRVCRTLDIIHTAARNSTRVHYTLIDVAGHTDTSGPYGYNIRLSQRRAQAVAAELERQGVPGNAIDIHAYGYTQVLVPTGPDVREPQNRRVEIVFEE